MNPANHRPLGGAIISAPDGSFGSAARLAASSGVRDSVGAGCDGAFVDSLLVLGGTSRESGELLLRFTGVTSVA